MKLSDFEVDLLDVDGRRKRYLVTCDLDYHPDDYEEGEEEDDGEAYVTVYDSELYDKREIVRQSRFGDDLRDSEYVVMMETLRKIVRRYNCQHGDGCPGCAACTAKTALNELEL